MHRGTLLSDVFSSSAGDGGRVLGLALDAIERAGSGVVVYLPPEGGRLLSFGGGTAAAPPELSRPHGGTLREYGLGAQVLRELGAGRIRLLTNSPKRIAALHGYGLDLVDCVPLA
jgi:3,4-dihydroxy 2-butanone 4-phosphate synthase/GTP cyclohydrolase II